MSNKSYVDLLYAQSHTSQGRVAGRPRRDRQCGGQQMTAHTPGPWEAEQLPAGHFRILAKQGPLTVSPATIHSEGDAHLIAAAPELLEALDRLLATAPDHRGFTQEYYDAWTQARAVVTKAEGSK